jgi:hypothetical protein
MTHLHCDGALPVSIAIYRCWSNSDEDDFVLVVQVATVVVDHNAVHVGHAPYHMNSGSTSECGCVCYAVDPQDPVVLEASFRGVWRPLEAAIKKPFWYAVSVPQGVDPDEYKAHVKCDFHESCPVNGCVETLDSFW